MSHYANASNVETRQKVIELFQSGLTPQEIQVELNFKHHQPVYNILKATNVYEKRPTRYHRKQFFNERFFESIDSEEKAYFLGLIAADGSVDGYAHRMRIALQARDVDILHKLLHSVDATHQPVYSEHSGHPQYAVSLNSKLMRCDLINKGLIPNKSLNMTSEVMRHVPEDLVRHFLRGFFDGDGCVFLGGKYASGTKYCIDAIGTKEFLASSFEKYCVSNSPLKKYKSCDMWHWRTSSISHVAEFLKLVYKDASVYLDRKYNYVRDYVNSECAHVKLGELLEIFPPITANDNQQPSLPIAV